MSIRKCVLLLRDGHYLNAGALSFCQARLEVLAAVESSKVDEEALAALGPDVVLNFLSEKILKGRLLTEFPAINFHPATPDYPGRGGASLALFDGVPRYGATAHMIAREIDAGPILGVEEFDLIAGESCESVYFRAELASLSLFMNIVQQIADTGVIPPAVDRKWGRKPITKKEFQQWLVADVSKPEEFARKISAARHSRFPGPFVDVHGFRFAFHGGAKTDGKNE